MANNPIQDPEQNLPEWLRALRNKQAAADANNEPDETRSTSSESESVPETEPEWLKEIRKRHQGETAHDEAENERALTDTQPNQPMRLEKRRIRAEESEANEAANEESQPGSEVPEWLGPDSQAEIEPAQTEADDDLDQLPAVTPAFSSGEQNIAPGELPSWLQAIRPGGTSFPNEDTHADEMLPSYDVESAGPLAGLSGVLPAEPEIAKIGKAPVFSGRLEISESQYRHAAALRDLLAAETQPRQDYAATVARPARILNAIMSAALLLAALIPMINGSQTAPRPDRTAFPESSEVFNAIDVLQADAPVLVAFEVEPALYGEMQPALTAVLSHLLQKQARLVFISTQPGGPALAERLLQEQFADSPAIVSGDYVNLGYLSGGMAALSSFSSDPRSATLSALSAAQFPWESAALQPIDDLSDFGLVLVAASEAEDGRAWIEQTNSNLPDGMLLVTSAQAAPVLRPYLSSAPATLRGMVAGLSGAAYYEGLHNSDSLGRAYWDSYSYGLGAAVLIILLGGLYGRVIQLRPEKVQVKS